MITIKDFKDQDIEDVLKQPAICEKLAPEDKELEYFYKSCAEPIYVFCAAAIHDSHAKTLLEKLRQMKEKQKRSLILNLKWKRQNRREIKSLKSTKVMPKFKKK